MSDPAAKERAIRSLSAQIEQLGEVRNAGTRDPGFKLWRQTTLTLIQRLWPGDDSRSTRFRRVPFSPPSTRADQRSTREWYERGCGEVLQLLKDLLEEVQTEGLPAARKSSGADRSRASDAEEVFPTLSLPVTGGAPAVTRGSSEIPRLPEPPNTGTSATAPDPENVRGAEPPPAPAQHGAPESTHPMPAPTARSGHPGGKNGSRGPRNIRRGATKPRLKDLLGFGDESPMAGGIPPDAAPAPQANPQDAAPSAGQAAREVAPIESTTAAIAPESPAVQPPLVPQRPAFPTSVTPELRLDPGFESYAGAEEANDRALQSALEAALEPIFEADAGRAAAEFLQNSPVFHARPRAVEPRAVPPSQAFHSPAAIAVAAIAAEVTALGVAEGNRAQVRAALLDLATQLDRHEFTWDALREAVTFVMQFPPVGRRVLPLLIPYLDEAA